MRTLFTESQRRALHEATYARDKEARAEANRVWDSVVRYVRAQAKRDYPNLVRFHYKGVEGFFVYSHSTDLPSDVRVFLAPSESTPHFAPYRGDGFVVQVDVLIDEGSLKYLDTRITSSEVRKSFVHEYVHYLDRQRNPSLFRSGARAAKMAQAGNISAYFKTPEEFNAWFQAIAHQVESRVEGVLRAAANMKGVGRRGPDIAQHEIDSLKRKFSSFPSFVSSLAVEFDMMRAQIKGTKWERKWLKRLHGMYRELKPKVQALSLDHLTLEGGE